MDEEINKKFIFLKSLEKDELSMVVFWVLFSHQKVLAFED